MAVDSTLFLAVSCGIQALFAAKLLFILVQSCCGPRRILSNMKSCCCWPVLSLLRCLRAQLAQPSPEQKLVNDAVADMQVVMGHRFLHAYAVLSLNALLSIQYNVILGRARWMLAATTWTNVVVFGCLTLYVIFPKSLTKSTLSSFYVCGMGLAAAYLSPWHTPAKQLFDFALIMFVFFRLPAVILCKHSYLAFLCNMVFVVITTYRAMHEELELSMNGAFGSAYVSTLHRKSELKLRGADAEKQFSAASTLLGLCCDAVVELDSDFCLLSHSKALAALLLRTGNLAGNRFLDLICGADRERALEHLRDFGGHEGVFAHAFHTHILDSCATKLSAEVFQVKYNKTDGQICHLVGLREFSDAQLPDRRCDSDPSEYAMIDALDSLRSGEIGEIGEVDLEKGDANDDTDRSFADFIHTPRPKAFLNIEMDGLIVSAASAPVDHCVGMHLTKLFPQHMIKLLQQLYGEAKKLEESGHALRATNFSFAEMPVYWTPTTTDTISGSIHMLQMEKGPCVMISFSPPVKPVNRHSALSVQSTQSTQSTFDIGPLALSTPSAASVTPSMPPVREHL